MDIAGKKFGVMLSAGPSHPNFNHALQLAHRSLQRGADLYLYMVDEAVTGLDTPILAEIEAAGGKVFVCAYSLQKRKLPLAEGRTYVGLSVLSDIMSATDRFVSFTG